MKCPVAYHKMEIDISNWWLDSSVNDALKEKRRLWKIWKNGGSKKDYVLAKKQAKRRVFAATKKAEKEKMKD